MFLVDVANLKFSLATVVSYNLRVRLQGLGLELTGLVVERSEQFDNIFPYSPVSPVTMSHVLTHPETLSNHSGPCTTALPSLPAWLGVRRERPLLQAAGGGGGEMPPDCWLFDAGWGSGLGFPCRPKPKPARQANRTGPYVGLPRGLSISTASTLGQAGCTWIVLQIRVPCWIPNTVRHRYKKGI